jgi:site-specific recombinase XerD
VQWPWQAPVESAFWLPSLHISHSIRTDAIPASSFSDEEVLMLTTLYPRAFPKYLSLPLFGSIIEDFARWLTELGFTYESSRFEIRMVARMSKYFCRRGLHCLTDLTPSDFRACWKALARHIRDQAGSANTLKRYLQSRGILKPNPTVPPSRRELCVAAYSSYLQKVRGLDSITIQQHVRTSADFLRFLGFERAPQRLATITPSDLERFVERAGRRLQRGTLQHTVAVIRSFMRFLATRGEAPPGLDHQIDLPRVYRFEKLPRTLPWKTVQLFLKSIDQTTPYGLRDYTMFLLIATYGLRASDIAALTLDDIQWRKSSIRLVQPKTGTHLELPLTDQVGKALVRYLKQTRRPVPCRHVFMRMVAPIGPCKRQTVASAFRNRMARSGLKIRFTGAHCLRHSYATELLHQGASLKTIGDILGHQCFDSTSVYLRVATRDLRQVGLSVPKRQVSGEEDRP